jgi:hypothetical protein
LLRSTGSAFGPAGLPSLCPSLFALRPTFLAPCASFGQPLLPCFLAPGPSCFLSLGAQLFSALADLLAFVLQPGDPFL